MKRNLPSPVLNFGLTAERSVPRQTNLIHLLVEGDVRQIETGVDCCLRTRVVDRCVEGNVASVEDGGGREFELVSYFDDSGRERKEREKGEWESWIGGES